MHRRNLRTRPAPAQGAGSPGGARPDIHTTGCGLRRGARFHLAPGVDGIAPPPHSRSRPMSTVRIHLHRVATAIVLLLVMAGAPSRLAAQPAPAPLTRAHSHNDYEHPRPLLDALDHRFGSVEADIHLVDGQLLVAHDRDRVTPGRTLETLYLAPLHERVRRLGGVYPGFRGFTLLVDFKSDAGPTYAALREVLARHADMLTRLEAGTLVPGAVTVILSGNRPTATLAAEGDRLCFIDGRLDDLDRNPPPNLVPLVSESWRSVFRWDGLGEFPVPERRRLGELVARAHGQGRRLRFWAVPDRATAWRELDVAGVDLINTDRLADLEAYLSAPGR